ncbi:MAG: hypothetical protein HZC37_22010 [Burkholderiales bacterium]|nr:hypothetical protein [Burkholderiales bacterium]
MTASALIWSVVFGSLGAGYCLYGVRQRAPVPALCGTALIVLPYLLSNVYALVAACAVLAVVPFVIRP